MGAFCRRVTGAPLPVAEDAAGHEQGQVEDGADRKAPTASTEGEDDDDEEEERK